MKNRAIAILTFSLLVALAGRAAEPSFDPWAERFAADWAREDAALSAWG